MVAFLPAKKFIIEVSVSVKAVPLGTVAMLDVHKKNWAETPDRVWWHRMSCSGIISYIIDIFE